MMSLPIETSSLEYFCAPVISTDARVPSLLFGEYARALVELALDHCADLLPKLAPASREAVRAVIGQSVPWSVAWTPTLAELEAKLVSNAEPAAVWAAVAQMALHMAAEGQIPKGDIDLV